MLVPWFFMDFGGMDGCLSSKWVHPLVCQDSRAQTYSGVRARVGEFGGTEVDVKKQQRWCRAGLVELLLLDIATSIDHTEVSEVDTKVSELHTGPSGSDLARLGQSRAGCRGAKQQERFQTRTKAWRLCGQGQRQLEESAAFPGRSVLTAVGAGNWQSR